VPEGFLDVDHEQRTGHGIDHASPGHRSRRHDPGENRTDPVTALHT
jgi:hypothetical protein